MKKYIPYYIRNYLVKDECGVNFKDKYESLQLVSKDLSFQEMKEQFCDCSISDILKDIGIVNTRWFLRKDKLKSGKESLAEKIGYLITLILDNYRLPLYCTYIGLKESRENGYDRKFTFKVVQYGVMNNEKALCYLTIQTEPCEVPKKISTSSPEGMKITDISVDGCDNIQTILRNLNLYEPALIDYLTFSVRNRICEDLPYWDGLKNDKPMDRSLYDDLITKSKEVSRIIEEYSKTLAQLKNST